MQYSVELNILLSKPGSTLLLYCPVLYIFS